MELEVSLQYIGGSILGVCWLYVSDSFASLWPSLCFCVLHNAEAQCGKVGKVCLCHMVCICTCVHMDSTWRRTASFSLCQGDLQWCYATQEELHQEEPQSKRQRGPGGSDAPEQPPPVPAEVPIDGVELLDTQVCTVHASSK